MSTKLVMALVLCDIAAHGLKGGTLVEAEAPLIKALQADGSVDPHKDAVAYGKAQGLPVVRSAIELAAETAAAAAAALRVDIAQLEGLLSKAEDEPTKGALSAQIVDKRAELAALAG